MPKSNDLITSQLLDAIAQQESNNDPSKVGDQGLKYPAYGAYQMRQPAYDDAVKANPSLAVAHLQDILNDPQRQRELAQAYLGVLVNRYGLSDQDQMIEGYNAGPTAVRRGRIPASTQQYLRNVKRRLAP